MLSFRRSRDEGLIPEEHEVVETSQSVVYVEKPIMTRLEPQGTIPCASLLRQSKIHFKHPPRRLEKTKNQNMFVEMVVYQGPEGRINILDP